VLLFVTVFSFDTGCYLVGTIFGKHHIAPKISSGKTWEGFVGGYLVTLLILAMLYNFVQQAPMIMALAVFTVCAVALAGDLFESWLKRRVGLKDSGMVLPGHGGLLDRFDSILFVTYLVYPLRDYLNAHL
jgi:phosphatidate cytidylyltransferase